jgi:hypothetical protein
VSRTSRRWQNSSIVTGRYAHCDHCCRCRAHGNRAERAHRVARTASGGVHRPGPARRARGLRLSYRGRRGRRRGLRGLHRTAGRRTRSVADPGPGRSTTLRHRVRRSGVRGLDRPKRGRRRGDQLSEPPRRLVLELAGGRSRQGRYGSTDRNTAGSTARRRTHTGASAGSSPAAASSLRPTTRTVSGSRPAWTRRWHARATGRPRSS